jgi:3',5'-cyclic AMP phosphodiesterase CpdA
MNGQKRNVLIAGGFLLALALSSCGARTTPVLSDYVSTIDYKSDFKVLQLTDVHWSTDTDIARQKKYLTNVVEEAAPDFIMITGDLFLIATEPIAIDLFDLINGWNIPYGVTWGNHDRQTDFSEKWESLLCASGANSKYKEVDDDVWGRSNYVIDLMDGDIVKWQLYSIDSNSYQPSSGFTYDYDYIHDDQVSWFESEAAVAKGTSVSYVPSVCYFHIPLLDLETIYAEKDDAASGVTSYHGEKNEAFCPSSTESTFLPSALSHGVKGMFWGHDHSNDWFCDYEGITMGYGVKSGKELYYHASESELSGGLDLVGGSLVTLHDDGTLSVTHVFVQDDADFTVNRVAY